MTIHRTILWLRAESAAFFFRSYLVIIIYGKEGMKQTCFERATTILIASVRAVVILTFFVVTLIILDNRISDDYVTIHDTS